MRHAIQLREVQPLGMLGVFRLDCSRMAGLSLRRRLLCHLSDNVFYWRIQMSKTGMTPRQVTEYSQWLRGQIIMFSRNPQVCRTFHECLTKLQGITGQPLDSGSDLPEDRS